MSKTAVERAATDLISRCGITLPPVPVEQIAITNSIQIVRSAGEWSESGFLLRDSHHRTIIGVNSRTSQRRQRFTIAHELCHWVLHRGKPLIVDRSVMMINKRDDVSSQATDAEEIEANQFAAELLMPKKFMVAAVNDLLKSNIQSRDELVSTLARKFSVSNEAMGWRLINLGVLSNS